MTVYNRASYVGSAVESVLQSTWTDFELIVVDDCSTDGSLDTISDLAAVDSRVRLVRNESNLGDYPNRMRAASLASGEFLKYVDSDDLIYKHTLQVMVESMERFPEAALGLAHSLPEDESPYPWCLSPLEAYSKQFLGRGCLSCGPSAAIIRRHAYEQSGGFRPEWGVLSDYELWLRMSMARSVVLLPPGLVWWRRHGGQEYTKEGAEYEYLSRGFELEMQYLTAPGCPLDSSARDRAIEIRRHRLARRILSIGVKQRRWSLARSLCESSGLSVRQLLRGIKNQV